MDPKFGFVFLGDRPPFSTDPGRPFSGRGPLRNFFTPACVRHFGTVFILSGIQDGTGGFIFLNTEPDSKLPYGPETVLKPLVSRIFFSFLI